MQFTPPSPPPFFFLCTVCNLYAHITSCLCLCKRHVMHYWIPFYPNTAACPSFNINYPPMRTLLCPGDIITYTCAFSSSSIITIALWTGSGFQCTGSPVNSTIILTQLAVPVSCGSLSAVITNISGTCYTSVLTIPTPQYFNGTTVTCRDGNFGTLIGSDTLQVQLASRLKK